MASEIRSQQYSHIRTLIIYYMALLCIPLSGICTDLYTPSLPAITAFFNIQKSYVQMTISAFLIGFCLFQLIAGPVVDIFGRRIPLYFALFINAIIAALIPHQNSIYTIIFLRLIQGGTVAISSVAARSIIIDIYIHTKDIFLRKMSMISVFWGLGPILAPVIGGFIQYHFNWQANFYLMASYLLILSVGVLLFVPETHIIRGSKNFYSIFNSYKTILKNKKFLAYSLSCGPMCACLVLFAISGSFIIQATLKYSSIVFGNVSFAVGVAWLIGAMFCRSVIGGLSDKIFYYIFGVGLFLSTIMVVSGTLGFINLWLIAIPVICISGIASFIFTNHYTQALSIFPKYIGGVANALSSSINTAETVMLTAIVALLSTYSQVPLGLAYFGVMLFALMLFYLFLQHGSNGLNKFLQSSNL